MKIGELAERSDVSIHTIRYYEQLGLLEGTMLPRDENNYRRYAEDAVERIQRIKQGQLLGLSLAEIRSLLIS